MTTLLGEVQLSRVGQVSYEGYMSLVCCEFLSNLLKNVGEKGFAVVAANDDGERLFYLQSRCLDPHVDPNVFLGAELVDDEGLAIAIAVAARLPLSYCPSCGAAFARSIRKNRKEFDEIAARMRRHFI